DGRGDDLSRLIDSLSHLSQAGYDNLPQTVSLIRDSDIVLGTQADQSDSILDWSHNIDLVAAQLQSGDPDLRRLLTTGNLSATQLSALLQRSGGDATTAIRNLATDVRTISPTFDRVSPPFAQLSTLSSHTQTTAPGDSTIHFGAVLETNNPPSCTYGYEGTQQIIDDVKKKNPAFNIDYDDFPFNTAANCDVAQGNPTDVRGAGRAVLSDPSIPQPWDGTPKKDPDTLNLNPLATQLATLLGVHPT
ncbi:phospholipid/cholesterol/gamma-HCH transport system substrate-binding protein, partial [Williamsia sterculiae]